jgi:copper chaperone CopZ
MSEITYTVPAMSCGHCKQAVSSELAEVAGVESIDVAWGAETRFGLRRWAGDAAVASASPPAGGRHCLYRCCTPLSVGCWS